MYKNIAINGKATKTKKCCRMDYSVGINIKAKPEKVWAILTNSANFPKWNSTIKSLEGKIALGETIKLVATVAPTRTFKLRVVEFSPARQMIWSDGNFMFKGVRTYILNTASDGTTDFIMSEVYTGLMLPLIAGSLPNFIPVFEQYAQDLKNEAEKHPVTL